MRIIRILSVLVASLLSSDFVLAEDSISFRDRSLRGERPIVTLKGKIDASTLAGVRIGGRTIPAGDVEDVELDLPGSTRLDFRDAVQAERDQKYDDAIKRFRLLAASPAAKASQSLKRYLEFRAALAVVAMAEAGPIENNSAIAAMQKFIADHPDCWERVGATRILARLATVANPPNYDVARTAFEQLASASGVPPELLAECKLSIVNFLTRQGKTVDARRILGSIAANDPRLPVYRLAIDNDLKNVEMNVKQLQQMLETADDGLKPTIYNALGDIQRLDPKRQRDALFSYLWVDVVYNQDPFELERARVRLAELFAELKDNVRAKQYKDKLRIRPLK